MKNKWRTEVPTDKYLLKIADVAKILGIHKERIRIMMVSKVMPGIRIGRVWYIGRDKLNAWLTGLYTDRFEVSAGAGDGGRQGGSEQCREGSAGGTSGPGADREGEVNLR